MLQRVAAEPFWAPHGRDVGQGVGVEGEQDQAENDAGDDQSLHRLRSEEAVEQLAHGARTALFSSAASC